MIIYDIYTHICMCLLEFYDLYEYVKNNVRILKLKVCVNMYIITK